MAKKHSPAKLWDHCLELEAYIHSNTALDLYELQGQVPKTLLLGQTSDISPFMECGWYDWVFWYDTQAKYPELHEVLGKWLGPTVDISPAMTAKILKDNGEVLYLSSYRPLSDDELQNPELTKQCATFDEQIQK